MLISVVMMCGGSLVIACLPTYAQIGAWAPFLLLLCRLFQGLSVGGEYGTTATYMSEVALRGQRGFFSSFQYVTLIGGQLLAVLVIVVLQQLLSEAELKAWGWRIPFVIGAGARRSSRCCCAARCTRPRPPRPGQQGRRQHDGPVRTTGAPSSPCWATPPAAR
jgi:MFS family permease